MALDTHREIETLKKIGTSKELAEAIVKLYSKNQEQLVTRSDLNNTELVLRTEIQNTAVRLDAKIDNIATRIESSIRELNKDISWLKTTTIANFTILLGGVITMWFK